MQCCTKRSPRVQQGKADYARGGFAKLDLYSTHNPSPVVVDERAITNSFEIGDDLEEAPRSTFYISKLYFRILLLSKRRGLVFVQVTSHGFVIISQISVKRPSFIWKTILVLKHSQSYVLLFSYHLTQYVCPLQ